MTEGKEQRCNCYDFFCHQLGHKTFVYEKKTGESIMEVGNLTECVIFKNENPGNPPPVKRHLTFKPC